MPDINSSVFLRGGGGGGGSWPNKKLKRKFFEMFPPTCLWWWAPMGPQPQEFSPTTSRIFLSQPQEFFSQPQEFFSLTISRIFPQVLSTFCCCNKYIATIYIIAKVIVNVRVIVTWQKKKRTKTATEHSRNKHEIIIIWVKNSSLVLIHNALSFFNVRC